MLLNKNGFLLVIGLGIILVIIYIIMKNNLFKQDDTVACQWNYNTKSCNPNKIYRPDLSSCPNF